MSQLPSEDSEGPNIRVLTLNLGENKKDVILKMRKGWYLEFALGPSLFGRNVVIYANIPQNGGEFSRHSFHAVHWQNLGASDDSLYARVLLTRAGSYKYYFSPHKNVVNRDQIGSGYIVVDPILMLDEEVPLDGLRCLTFISKCLGPLKGWQSQLEIAKETGYNMIHFTPIQELGQSNSAYCIRDQLKLNPKFEETSTESVATLINNIRRNWKMFSICDVVLNHTANESEWLRHHPECAYNLSNTSSLKSAYILDVALWNFSLEVGDGLWETRGVPEIVDSEHHLEAIRHALFHTVIPALKLEELYTVDVEACVGKFLEQCRNVPPPKEEEKNPSENVCIIFDPEYRRMRSDIDMKLALNKYNVFRKDCFDEDSRLHKCAAELKRHLDALNNNEKNVLWTCLTAAVENVVSSVKYERVQWNGPRLGKVTRKNPLFMRYFTDFNEEASETHAFDKNAVYVMAHNGWVMNANPLKDTSFKDYLMRELIAWGDMVKLRYGLERDNCPYLWDRMRRYVEQVAEIFDGIRLDNCHSTPIHVAQFMLDAARAIKPDLYVVAELFTNSESTDNIFVNRLGITSLIRESMSAWNSHELGRLVYLYGGAPVGSFSKPIRRPLTPSRAHALFLDLTHDNPSPTQKRSSFDMLPNAALVASACCATGSNAGYDYLVPHHVHVVEEQRRYPKWGSELTYDAGMVAAKRALNDLHAHLAEEGFSEVFVDQMDADVVCVTRHNPNTRASVVVAAYTAFDWNCAGKSGPGRDVTVSGMAEAVLMEACLRHKSSERYAKFEEFQKNNEYINGLTEYELRLKMNLNPESAEMVRLCPADENSTTFTLTNEFKPGSVVVVKFEQSDKVKTALYKLRHPPALIGLYEATLGDLNQILYRSGPENEANATYEIPNFGHTVYAGLQGVQSIMERVAIEDDLGHPACDNLRKGVWMAKYATDRIRAIGLSKLADAFDESFKPLEDIPPFLVPRYFHSVHENIYEEIVEVALAKMDDSVRNSSEFYKLLALCSVQFAGIIPSSPLPPLSKNLSDPKPKTDERGLPQCVTLSAGLPHFAQGFMRNWGRDTFISLRGLFLLIGRWQEARYIILAYGGCLRHGLIPNLLDGGYNARYNCRDAVWWWLYTIQAYVKLAPGGSDILKDVVNRLYPTDDSPATSVDQKLCEVMQEALNTHFQGLQFRERNAGVQIDAHMKSPGFDNQIGIHPETGFVFGGNEWNCGTWMDKMGSSEAAGIRGKPATPRDGSAVELVALCKCTVDWLADMHENGLYPYQGVERKGKDGSKITWTFRQWGDKISDNFRKKFWIGKERNDAEEETRPDLIHRTDIYKDTYGSSQPWADYQLRCNYVVAMAIYPDLFEPKEAWAALEMVKKHLLGPLGMKTLDPADWAYHGVYDNTDDSTDAKRAHGFNYHQGPEWLWPVGFYVRARLDIARKLGLLAVMLPEMKAYLSRHYQHMKASPWKGLPELTNADGVHCPFSCPTQAWSAATILEAVYDITRAENH